MIIHVRRRLLKAAKELRERHRAGGAVAPRGYRYHREQALGATEEEAIANVRGSPSPRARAPDPGRVES